MRQRHGRNAGRQVGDERKPRHANAAGVREDGLGHGTHAHDIRAKMRIRADFRRRLEHGPRREGIDPFHDPQLAGLRGGVQQIAQMLGIDVGHVRETRPPLFAVGPRERIDAHRVDVVAQDDEVAGMERGIDAAHGVGEQQTRAAHAAQQLHRRDNGFPAHALVPVAPPAEGCDATAKALVEHEFAYVPRDGRAPDTGNVGVGNAQNDMVLDQRFAPAAAQHHA